MSYRTEFPEFARCPQVEQLLAAGFSDRSWHNDSCPSFVSPDGALRVWIEFADLDMRDNPDVRFVVQREEQDTSEGEVLAATDSWADVCRLLGLPAPTALQTLAVQFALCLLEDIGADALAEVVRVNAASNDPMVCASQDHCDANMTMGRAFVWVFGREPYMPSDWEEEGICTEQQADADLAAWNDAWTLAKNSGFRLVHTI